MRKRVSILLVVSAVLFCFSGSKVYSKAEKNNDIRDFNKKWRLSFFLGEKENYAVYCPILRSILRKIKIIKFCFIWESILS